MKNELYKIFTPSSPAINTFVERKYVERQLIKGLNTPGKQIIIFGPSGSGKSTLILNKYNIVFTSMIRSICQRDTTFAELIKDAFDQLNEYYVNEYKKGETGGIKGEASFSFWTIITNKFEGSYENTNEQGYNRVVEFQLNERNLSKLLREANCCWVIEDFHKVVEVEKNKLADSLKLFTDDNSKIIAIGAVNSPAEVLSMNREMNHRIAEISVPLMSEEELLAIIKTGTEKLNVSFSDELAVLISRFSFNYGANCHQLCLNIFEDENIYDRQKNQLSYDVDKLKKSIDTYLFNKASSFNDYIKKAIEGKEKNTVLKERIIIKYLNLLKDEVSMAFLSQELEETTQAIETAINDMVTDNYGEFFQKEYNSENYSIQNPFLLAYLINHFRESLNKIEFSEDEKEIPNLLSNHKAVRYIMDME